MIRNTNTSPRNSEIIIVETSAAKNRKGWDNENSTTSYYIDYLRGYIERRFLTKYDFSDDYDVEFCKSYYDNKGGEVEYTTEMEKKFNAAVKRIKKQIIW